MQDNQEKLAAEMDAAPNALEVLLGMEPPQTRTARIKMVDLSASAGAPVVFQVRGLPYDTMRALLRESGERDDINLAIILAGVTEPDLKRSELLTRYHAPTPEDLLPKLLSAGEISELAQRIEQLSGYRRTVTQMVEDIKKK